MLNLHSWWSECPRRLRARNDVDTSLLKAGRKGTILSAGLGETAPLVLWWLLPLLCQRPRWYVDGVGISKLRMALNDQHGRLFQVFYMGPQRVGRQNSLEAALPMGDWWEMDGQRVPESVEEIRSEHMKKLRLSTSARESFKICFCLVPPRPMRVPIGGLVHETLAVGVHHQSSMGQGPAASRTLTARMIQKSGY